VSAKDFGAVGDGVTDDTAAIQAALNTGKPVNLGDFTNTYLVQSPISYTGQVMLFGNGATIKSNIQWLKITNGNNSVLRGFRVLPATIPYTIKRDTITWAAPTVVQDLNGYIPGGQDTDIWPIDPAQAAVNETIKPLIYFTVSSASGARGLEISSITGYQLCIVVEGYTDINIHDNDFGGGQTTYGAITVLNGVSVAYNSAPLGFTLPRGLNNSIHNNNIKYATLCGIVWFGNDGYDCSQNTVSFNGESGIKTYQYDGVSGPSATLDVVSTRGRIVGNNVSDNFYDGIDAQLQYGVPFQYIYGGTTVQGNVVERNRRTGTTTNASSMVYVGNIANNNGSDGLRVIGYGNSVTGNHARNNCQYPDGVQVFDIIIQGEDCVSVGNCLVNPIAPSTYNYLHSGFLGADPTSGKEGLDYANYASEGVGRLSISQNIPSTLTQNNNTYLSTSGWYQQDSGPVLVTSSSHTVLNTDYVLDFYTLGTCTVTMPDPTAFKGRMIKMRNTNNFAINSASPTVQRITGGAPGTAILQNTSGKWCEMMSNGLMWKIIAAN
jgi:hypothetical protein